MSLYEPLTQFLESSHIGRVSLTFAEIEQILGRPLPASSRKHQAWWANTPSHSHAEAWMRPGWKTVSVDLARERLAFTRTQARSAGTPAASTSAAAPAPDGVRIDLDRLSAVGRRLVEDYAAETHGDLAAAVARAVHEAGVARRGRLIDQGLANAPRMPPGAPSIVDLIREDRDAR